MIPQSMQIRASHKAPYMYALMFNPFQSHPEEEIELRAYESKKEAIADYDHLTARSHATYTPTNLKLVRRQMGFGEGCYE